MIRIQNIYYMLSYAFQVLNEDENKYCHDRLGNETVKYIAIFYWL